MDTIEVEKTVTSFSNPYSHATVVRGWPNEGIHDNEMLSIATSTQLDPSWAVASNRHLIIVTMPSDFLLAQIQVPKTVSYFKEVAGEVVPEDDDPSEEATERIVSSIMEKSGFNRTEVAEKLLGVKRQATYLWKHQGGIDTERLERLLKIEEILDVALARQPASSDDHTLRWWLLTPRGESGVTPQELILSGQLGKARMLAMTAAPKHRSESPKWLKGRPNSPDTTILHQILNTYVNEDSHPDQDTSEGNPRD